MKIRQVAARIFSIPLTKIKLESTNTTRIANKSPTAASCTTDLNGHATRLACLGILARLKQFVVQQLGIGASDDVAFRDGNIYFQGKSTDFRWDDLILDAYFNRVNLSEHAHYATPDLHFDEKNRKGRPFAYHVFGTAIIQATVDCLRGIYRIDSIKVVHDVGESLNPIIDRGQVEGGIVQGLGWMTTEELMYTGEGHLISHGFSTYKVPDIYSAPQDIQVHFLEGSDNPTGIFHSKGLGEPPFMYGIGAWFAIARAMKAFRPDLEISDSKIKFSAPMTPEKVLLSLYGNPTHCDN